jgi:hypothetical protein
VTTRTTVRGEYSLAALIERLGLEPLDRRLTAVGHRDLVAGLPEHDREQIPHALLVVDDQDAGIRHRWREA